MRIITVVGARPNFVKVASFLRELETQDGTDSLLVHTGQHYDPSLSDLFFDQLCIRKPDLNLGVGSGTHAQQTARVMTGFEEILRDRGADCVVVVGDVNSTMACAITAKKASLRVAHIEAGLRSGDMSMPEEINRRVTDSISDFHFTTTPEAGENLRREGVPRERIFFVGNIMIDSLMHNRRRASELKCYEEYGLSPSGYVLLTLHRPSNVDNAETLFAISKAVGQIHSHCPVLFLAHPRTRLKLQESGLARELGAQTRGKEFITTQYFHLANPVGYLEMLNLTMHAKFVITDSGGVQEETTVLGVPCLTFRDTTERPETERVGTNILVGTNPDRLAKEAGKILAGQLKKGRIPELWDGQTGARIVHILCDKLKHRPQA